MDVRVLKSPRAGYEPVNRRSELPLGLQPSAEVAPAEWDVADRPVPYMAALARMDERAAAIAAGTASELIWLVEHPPL